MAIEISVVICTYNRADILKCALDTILDQALDQSCYEVIIVDNNSSDQTEELVRNFSRVHTNFRYVFEKRVGLSYARNRGWKVAQGRYIAFTDDDCKLPRDWLVTAKDIIQRKNPKIFGGPYYPYYLSPKAGWFKNEYRSKIISDTATELKNNEFLSGGNMFIHYDILESAKEFDPTFGMKGNTISYGEETSFIIWVRENIPNTEIYYDPALYVYHLVEQEWMHLPWVLQQRFISGRSNYHVFSRNRSPLSFRHYLGVFGLVCIIGFECTIGLLLRDRKKYPFWQNYIFEQTGSRFITLGKLYERLYQARPGKQSDDR